MDLLAAIDFSGWIFMATTLSSVKEEDGMDREERKKWAATLLPTYEPLFSSPEDQYDSTATQRRWKMGGIRRRNWSRGRLQQLWWCHYMTIECGRGVPHWSIRGGGEESKRGRGRYPPSHYRIGREQSRCSSSCLCHILRTATTTIGTRGGGGVDEEGGGQGQGWGRSYSFLGVRDKRRVERYSKPLLSFSFLSSTGFEDRV